MPAPKSKLHTLEKIQYSLKVFKSANDLIESTINKNSYNSTLPYFSRSFLWKVALLNITFNSNTKVISLKPLKELRSNYESLANEFQVPWNQLSTENEYYQALSNLSNFEVDLSSTKRIRVNNDPLSPDSSSIPLNNQTDLQLLEILITDVNRLFPQLPKYFINNFKNKKNLIEILFIWSKLSNVQYQQGYHELIGMVYITIYKERINKDKIIKRDKSTNSITPLTSQESSIVEFMDEEYLKNDVFAMFNCIINPIIKKYYSENSLLNETIKFDLKLHEFDRFQYHLFKNKLKLDSAIWLIRWFRLLLIREIGIASSLRLWDHLICFDKYRQQRQQQSQRSHYNTAEEVDITVLLPYLIILLLSLVKSKLIISDYGEALFLLLHYPANKDDFDSSSSSSTSSKPNQPSRASSVILITSTSSNSHFNDNDGIPTVESPASSPSALSNDGTENDDDGFEYVDETIFKNSISSSMEMDLNTLELSGSPPTSNAPEKDEMITLDVEKLVTDAIMLFELSHSDSNGVGVRKLIESYSGMVNEFNKKNGEVVALNKKKLWSLSGSGGGKEKTVKRNVTLSFGDGKKDFDRTRLEMKLQKRVLDAMNK